MSFPKPTHLLLAALAAGSVYALAQQAGGGLGAKFKQLDKNHDGKLTVEELPAGYMDKLDLNHDGEVTQKEALEAVAKGVISIAGEPSGESDGVLANRMFDQADKDHDGKVTREESNGARWFDRLDQNKDGILDRQEVVGVAKQIREYVQKNKNADDLPQASEPVAPVAEGPRVINGGEVGVGRQLDDVSFTDLKGQQHTLSELAKGRGLVIAYTSTTCPVSKRYTPALQRIEKDLSAIGIATLFVNPFSSETNEDLKAVGFASTYVHDTEKKITGALDARSTTEVFFIDSTRTLLYRGALDDQYGVRYNRDAPTQNFLLDAISAHLAGRLPLVAATEAPGCELDRPEKTASTTTVTYHRDVARILQQNCVECHHQNGIAPFALDDVSEVTDRAKVIKRVVTQGTMPPWFAAPSGDGKPSPWANDCSLGARDKADLLAWLDSGDRPLGSAADAPAPLQFPDEWLHGKPDLIVQIPKPVRVTAEGFMPYQVEVAETNLTEDKWVQGYEIVPTDRSVVHHVIVNVHTGKGKIHDREEGADGYWAAYVPGNPGQMFPPGYARKLPAGARISFQIHYTPSGKDTQDQLKLGLIFAKEPPKYVVKTLSIPRRALNIPPGDANHTEVQEQKVPYDLSVMAFVAHMHLRGKSFRFDVTYPDGKAETLLDIPHYDFNWQLRYDYAVQKIIPRGSTMKITAVYDNSAANKANPDPSKRVRWGPQTYDEMMIGYVEVSSPYHASETAAR